MPLLLFFFFSVHVYTLRVPPWLYFRFFGHPPGSSGETRRKTIGPPTGVFGTTILPVWSFSLRSIFFPFRLFGREPRELRRAV